MTKPKGTANRRTGLLRGSGRRNRDRFSAVIGLQKDTTTVFLSESPEASRRDERIYSWALTSLCAGSSALLLLIVTAFPRYWFISLVALIPMLCRVLNSEAIRAMQTGLLFGFMFTACSTSSRMLSQPFESLAAVLSGSLLLALYGWIVAVARKAFGLRPSIVALLWVGFELLLVRAGFSHGLFGETRFTDPFARRLVFLFGFLVVSFAIVYLNASIALTIDMAVALITAKIVTAGSNEQRHPRPCSCGRFRNELTLIPQNRGPPAAQRF